MGRFSTIVLGFLGVLAAALPAGAVEYTGPGFAADMLFAKNGDALKTIGRIYVSRSVMRMETEGGAILIDFTSGSFIMLMPDQGMYVEFPPNSGPVTAYQPIACATYRDKRKQGSETVSGRATTKWRCLDQHQISPRMQPSDTTMWFDDSLEFWIRDVRDSGEVTELRNIEVGVQPDSLFEVPDGYQKVTIPGGQNPPKQ